MFSATEQQSYTFVQFELPSGVITPDQLSTIDPPQVNPTKGVVISGRGPVWLFATLVHYYHPTAWVATHDPRLGGAVVTQSHVPGVFLGQVISLD